MALLALASRLLPSVARPWIRRWVFLGGSIAATGLLVIRLATMRWGDLVVDGVTVKYGPHVGIWIAIGAGAALIVCASLLAFPAQRANLAMALSEFPCTNCQQSELRELNERDGSWSRRFKIGLCRACDWDSEAW
jgi:hypothetical protein